MKDYLAEFIRELCKEQYGDPLDQYFRLRKNLNPRFPRVYDLGRITPFENIIALERRRNGDYYQKI